MQQHVVRRLIAIGLLALLVFGAVRSVRQSAWIEGYQAGQFTAATAGTTNVAPPLWLVQRGPNPFGFVVLAGLGIGALAFMHSRRRHWDGWGSQGAPEGHAGEAPGMRFGPPHMSHGGPGCFRHGPPPWAQPQSRRPQPAGTDAAAPAPSSPAEPAPRESGPVAFV